MNKKKWRDRPHTTLEFLAKLGEEFGEVSRVVTDEFDGDGAPDVLPSENFIDGMIEELEHVSFIADCWRHRLLQFRGGSQ
jgi:hypothetical protein